MSEQGTATTEIAVREERQEVSARFDGASEGITTFLADLSVAYEIASRLVTTSFVPQSYANKPQEAAAAIVAGQGVGLGPMESLRSIDIIQGTPAMRAITLRALVVSRGHDLWLVESSPTRAVVSGRRAGSDNVQTSEWDMDRARTMGLVTKDNWRKQPGAMLIARATSECARLVAPDALLGIPYSSEELQDLDVESAPSAPKKRRGLPTLAARARAAEAASAAVDVQAEPVSAPERAEAAGDPVDAVEVVFPCARCGEMAADSEDGICGPCEDAIEAEMAGEETDA